MRREIDQILRKVTFCDGKRGKFFEKSFPAAGNGKNASENGFVRREKGAYGIRPQDVSIENDFAYPYK